MSDFVKELYFKGKLMKYLCIVHRTNIDITFHS